VFTTNEWNWHVWHIDGTWGGQFQTEEAAMAWLKKNPPYILNNTGPTKKRKEEVSE
jgi:hypothetical protein